MTRFGIGVRIDHMQRPPRPKGITATTVGSVMPIISCLWHAGSMRCSILTVVSWLGAPRTEGSMRCPILAVVAQVVDPRRTYEVRNVKRNY